MTLTDFLLARIAEDEAVARGAVDPQYGTDEAGRWTIVAIPHEGSWPRRPDDYGVSMDEGDDPWEVHASRHHPARVLAECEANRRIVSNAVDLERVYTPDLMPIRDVYDTTLGLLALPYADHADYDEAWKA